MIPWTISTAMIGSWNGSLQNALNVTSVISLFRTIISIRFTISLFAPAVWKTNSERKLKIERMKVLSLFDGMACGMLAFQSAGINVDRYVAFEIDKYAIQTSSHNFPMIEHHGDVFQADFTEFRGFDFLLAGFPCTKFSIAQKNDRETEPYSGEGWLLFEQAWRAVCEVKPQWFIFENNKSMAKAVQREISKIVGFEPICINSALVSAQNRQRIYWVGKRNLDGAYSRVKVEQPEDRGILLRDVLEGMTLREKATCLCGNRGGTSLANDLKKSRHNYAAEPVRIPEYGVSEKSRCVTASYAYKGSGEGSLVSEAFPENPNKQVRDYVAEPVSEPCIYQVPHGFNDGGIKYEKAPTLTANGSWVENNKVITCFAVAVEWDDEGRPTKAISGADGKTYTIYEVKDGQITIKGKQHPIKLADGFYIIRKLMVSECKRLQTVPEWYEFPVSDTQAYKMLGNGWTVGVIAHLIKAAQANEFEEEQLDLFQCG